MEKTTMKKLFVLIAVAMTILRLTACGTALSTAVSLAINDGLSAIYLLQDVHTYTAKGYFNIMEVNNIYSKDDDSHLIGPMTRERKVCEKYGL